MPDTLFTNASLVLDGFAERQAASHVLVKGGTIHTVSLRPLERGDATVIDVAGRTLMPDLIDAHCHITGISLSPKNIEYPASEIAEAAASYLRNSLMDGFTTIREAGGADYSIARRLADGAIVGRGSSIRDGPSPRRAAERISAPPPRPTTPVATRAPSPSCR